ncbi:MAG: hypothetical protein SNH55_07300 [Rikenellaceae bacterium]
MIKRILSITLICSSTLTYGANPKSTYGTEHVESSYFDDIYIYNNLVHYLDNTNLHITYQAETTGEYNQPDRMIFSVDGSSFRWNKYYLNGFRIDSRYFAGSTLYTPNMSSYNLGLDYIDSKLYFDSSQRKESASFSYNIGGIGGISAGTEDFIHLFHDTASDRAYKSIDERSSIQGAGTAELSFAIQGKDRDYMQSLYLNFGERYMVGFDNGGIDSYYPEKYGKVQLNGELPITIGGLFDKMDYITIYSQRDHLNSEFYYSEEESPALKSYSLSLYGSKRSGDVNYTSGFTFALNNTKHEDLNYSRNVIDHDGEGFEPWQPDGSDVELSYSLTLDKQLNEWLNLTFDGYNSLLGFNPSQNNFHNATYAQLTTEDDPTMLYLYEWQSKGFYSGLLENSLGLNTQKKLSEKVGFRANLDLTLDAMFVSGNSIVSPNVEARVGFAFRPTKWLDMELNLSRERVSYNIDDIRFLSDDYLSGEAYYINDNNNNGVYDSGEKGGLFITTGGAYNTLSDSAKQPTYYVVDIPINITLGRHSLALLQSYRKYCNNWSVSFDGEYSDYGYMEYTQTQEAANDRPDIFQEVFFFDGGKEVNYVVGEYPDGIMGDNFLTSSPFFFCSNVEYSYTAPKFMLTLNWQSYMMSGISTLGNGPLHNNIGALSQSSANPNTTQVVRNLESEYSAIGRLDQDRAYIARIFASYRVTDKLSVAVNAKFKDGQPFSIYRTEIISEGANNQLAMIPVTSRGTNTADGNFGTREDAIFNIDLRLKYLATIAKRRCEIGAYCYNIYDFGNELTEYIFDQDINGGRCAMSLTIPRGLIFSFKMDL